MVSREGENNFAEYADSVRQRFSDAFKDNIQKNLYDSRDLDRLKLEDDYVSCFLRHQKGSVEEACKMIDTSLRWRKELGVNDLMEQTFPRAMHEVGGVFYHNHDKNGNPILHIAVAKHRKDPATSLLVKQLLAWHIDKEFIKNLGRRIVVLIDMTDAGLSNVDMDLLKFQVSCFTTYYPAILAYMLIYEMPWVLNAIWSIIKNLLNAEQQRHVLLVKKRQMLQYIDEDKLFVHMGGSDTYKFRYMPSEDSGIAVRESDCESLVSSCEQSLTPTTALRRRVTFGEIPKCSSVDSSHPGDRASNVAISEDNNIYRGPLANISPSECLAFHTDLSKGDTVSHIYISNTSQQKLSYKVKTTSPDAYRVKPRTGFLAVNDRATITITLPNGHQCSDQKDKFLVMLLALKNDVSENNQALLSSLWKEVTKDSEDYMEHRLICEKVQTEKVQDDGSNSKTISRSSSHSSENYFEDKVENLAISQQKMSEQLQKIIRLLMLLTGLVLILLFVVLLKHL